MALILRSNHRHRAGKQLLLYQTPLRSLLRRFSGQSKAGSDDDTDLRERSSGEKAKKSRTKSKRVKSMARAINSMPWSSELESSLSSLSPSLSKTTVLQTLRLIQAPSKALQFFDWVEKMGFSHTARSFFLMLEILGKGRDLNAARNLLLSIEERSNGSIKLEDPFFNSLISRYGKAGLYLESIQAFETMKSIGVSPSVVSFNKFFSMLLKRGRTVMAKRVFDEMLSTYGVTPDTCTFNILIRGFCMNSMVDEGFRFFQEMERHKCDPDIITYNTIVDGLCRAGKVGIARNVVKGMSKKSLDLNPNVVTYTTLVRGYCMKQEVDEALFVFQEMISQGLKPSHITYNTLIKGLSEVHRYDKIKDILEGMGQDGSFIPDTCTFNTLINAHCIAGNMDEAWIAFKRMSEMQVQPDSATYSVIIRSFCQREDFEKAEEIFDELAEKEILLSDVGCTPFVAAYNPMFQYLCGSGKTKKAERVFRQLLKRGKQDLSAYMTLISGHCREGTFKAGYDLLILMLKSNLIPSFEIFDSLIGGLLQKGEPLLAHSTLEKMLTKTPLRPKTSSVHHILEELVKKDFPHEAASLVTLMLDRKIRQNIHLSTETVKRLFARKLQDKAFQIIGVIYDSGYVVDMKELVGFLCQSGNFLEACKILQFSLEKGQSADVEMCSTVIEGLCNSKRLSEAFGLYYELVEREKHQQLRCLENLKIALERGGRLHEAEFVSKRIANQMQSNDAPPQVASGMQKSRQQ